jgi:pimeloyl-ACP methyl ester carboxylesterase
MGNLDMNKILILHGWTYSLAKWDYFVSSLKRNGLDVKILEIPGLTEVSDEIWDLEKYSKWLDRMIGDSKVILLGHSNGGRIASYYTSMHPEKVFHLILIDTAGIYYKGLYIQIKRFIFGSAAKLGKKITQSEVVKKFLYKLAGESDYQKATPNMRKSMLNLIKEDLTENFKRIIVKTLIIWGENDKITPVGDAKLIHNLIKDSKLEIVKGARHSPFYTHPEEVVRIIKNGI